MDMKALLEKASDLRNNGKVEEAVKVYSRVVGLAIQKDDTYMIGEATHMIGSAYYIDGKYELARDYLLDGLDQFKRLNNTEGWGATLRDLGLNAQKMGKFDEAKDYFYNSIYQLRQTENWSHVGMTQVKLGLLFSEMEDLDKAEETIKEGLENVLKTPNSFFTSTAYFDLAKLQKKMEKLGEAKSSTEKALGVLDKISNREQFQRRRKEIEKFLTSL
jgi:tetratricopeptide (TPR) repeat protein